MIASHNVLTQVVTICPGINLLVTRVHVSLLYVDVLLLGSS